MNLKISLVLLALSATVISAACPGPVIIKTFSNTVYTEGSDVTASVDSGYKLIGGGFYTPGPLLRESYPSSSTQWTINTSPITADVGPAPVTAYAIGLYDPDNCWTVQTVTAGPFGQGATTGSGSAVCPSGTTLVGGGATTDNFLNNNYPDTIRGDATSAFTWSASFNPASSSFVGASQTGMTVYALCLRPTGSGYTAGNFINNAVGSSSYSATATSYLQIVGGGYIINGQYGAATASFNNSNNAWESDAQQQPGTSIQSLSIGLGFSAPQASTSNPSTPTTTPTTTPTSPSKSCEGQIITTPRSNSGSWTSGNTFYQIYDFTVKNLGDCPIVRATYDSIFTGPNNPGVSQKWNIGDSPSGDQVLGSLFNLFGNSIPAGGSRTGYGVVAYNATGVTGVAKGPTTFCDASCTNSA